MIEIKVNTKGKKIEVETMAKIEGYDNAVMQFLAVLTALDKTSEDVLVDALEEYMKEKMGDNDNDESDS